MNFKIIFIVVTSFCIGCATSDTKFEAKNTISDTFTPKNIKIYTQTSKNSLGPCEPSICIDPTNPNNIVAGSVLNYTHRSNDGGLTWKTDILKSKFGVWGDPSIIADNKGNFYYFHLSDPEGTNWKSTKILDRIVCQSSNDKGLNWSTGIGIGLNSPKQQDKQWAAINPINNDIYVTWTEFDKYNSDNPKDKSRILFSKSTDLGKHWSIPTPISTIEGDCKDDDNTTEGAVPVSDGKNIFVAWSYNNKIWFNKSNDFGASWLPSATVITNQNAGWKFKVPGVDRVNGFPVTGIDISKSKYNGTIYVNWSDQTKDGITKVYICKSLDKGVTWSTPQLVNSQPKHQFFNWMTVDSVTGFVYIIYYEESSIPNLINVKISVSKDGTKSFKSYTISENAFDPRYTNFFGDYNNIDARNGVVRPIWTQAKNGLLSVWTAIINEKDLR